MSQTGLEKLVGRTVVGIRIGVYGSFDEEQADTVAEFTLDTGEVVLVAATDPNNERYFSTFEPWEEDDAGGVPEFAGRWYEELTSLKDAP